ncbi:MAG: 2-C-methyl-D-erythritol 4-phosphate cytidylyltransferase [Chloroflexi bacterium]|nr:2-C-methyl-D-erythritol 4-phosphate cytidylyltransferase [Chloroflexota bacterium]
MGGQDKLLALLAGQPVLAYCLTVIARHPAVTALVVVATPDRLAAVGEVAAVAAGARLTAVVAGGARRQDSVRAGVAALPSCDAIAIHDGARPFLTAAMLDRGLAALAAAGAALAVAPVIDTIKEVDTAGRVLATPPRAALRAAQTPQFFRAATLRAAYAAADWSREVTDEAMLVEALGEPVLVVEGSPLNHKITTPVDLVIAAALLRAGLVGT